VTQEVTLHADLGPYVFVAAIIVIAAAALVAVATGQAPVVLSAFAQTLQALSRGLLWALQQRSGGDDKDSPSS
jgi:hypothetical protein